MIRSTQHYNDPRHASVYDAIVRWASHAPQRVLAGIAAVAVVAAAALLAVDWRQLSVAGVVLAAGAIGGWGLLEQRAEPHSTLVRVGQALLVALGIIAAVVGGFGVLFWVMGPAPVL